MAQIDITSVPLLTTTSMSAGFPVVLIPESLRVVTIMGATLTPYVYVVDSGNNRVQAFDYNGNFQFAFGAYGSGNGQFSSPYGIADDGDFLYVTDPGNARVQIFTLLGVYVSEFGSVGSAAGEFDNPMGIAVDERYIYVVDSNNNRFQIFAKDGAFLYKLGTYGTGLNQFDHPTDCSDDTYYLYITDAGNSRIVIYPKTITYGAHGYMTFPSLSVASTLEERSISTSMIFTSLEVESHINSGNKFSVAAVFPSLEVLAMGGGHGDCIFPALNVDSTALSGGLVSGDLILPLFESDSSISIEEKVGGDLIFPSIEVQSTIGAGWLINTDIMFPSVSAEAVIISGQMVTGDIVIPLFQVSSEIIPGTQSPGDHVLTGSVILPIFLLDATASQSASAPTYYPIVMTIETKAVVEYDNYGFNSMTFFNGKYLGANSTGIYDLDGDKDAGANINAIMSSGIFDLHDGIIRKPREAYLSYRSDGILKVTITEDEDVEREYRLDKAMETIHDKRLKIPRGVGGRQRARFYQFKIENVSGADFDIDSLRLQTEPVPARKR